MNNANSLARAGYSLCLIFFFLCLACSAVLREPITTTAESLASDYAKDESAADKKYKGSVIRATGTIESLLVTDKGNRGISLKGVASPYRLDVLCTVDNNQREAFDRLKEGQNVTVEGTCEGLFVPINVDLGNCSIK